MKPWYSLTKDESGSIAALSLFLLFVCMGLLAFVIDLGHLYVVKAELQNAADAGALAGARALFLNNSSANPDWSAGETATSNAIQDNKAENSPLLGGQVETGFWDLTWFPATAPANLKPAGISPSSNDTPAVKVMVKKSAGSNKGPVSMSFGQLLGINTVDVSRRWQVSDFPLLSGRVISFR